MAGSATVSKKVLQGQARLRQKRAWSSSAVEARGFKADLVSINSQASHIDRVVAERNPYLLRKLRARVIAEHGKKPMITSGLNAANSFLKLCRSTGQLITLAFEELVR
jgi:hypothetical protein